MAVTPFYTKKLFFFTILCLYPVNITSFTIIRDSEEQVDPLDAIKGRYTWLAPGNTSGFAADGLPLDYLRTINPNGPWPVNLAVGRPVYAAPRYSSGQ